MAPVHPARPGGQRGRCPRPGGPGGCSGPDGPVPPGRTGWAAGPGSASVRAARRRHAGSGHRRPARVRAARPRQALHRTRAGQEDRPGALGLVLNAAVLWTTRYLDAAVDPLRALPPEEREHDVLDEDVARVSPLKHTNLNRLGRYSFATRPPREGLRPLRDPATVHLDEDDEGTGE
ncbi:Tn3 family transposase [Streptomyces mirabilis]|uniref:Tn3 family transposase n=1 Tax=Streptomyces mirabilis TaxID=68239 RepID=UPI003319C3B8